MDLTYDALFDINDPNSLKKMSDHGISGLVNLGNTCYLNSAIQLISNIKVFSLYFVSNQFREDIADENKEVLFLKEWVTLIHAMWEDISETKPNCIVKPVSLRRRLGEFYAPYAGSQQHDGQEAVGVILDILHKSLCYEASIKSIIKDNSRELTRKERITLKSIESWSKSFEREYSIPVSLFYGQFYSEVKCDACGHISETFEPFNTLLLPIGQSCITIYDCIENFGLSENIDADCGWSCDKCKKQTSAKKKVTIWKLPPILIIAFKRFEFKRGGFLPVKINTRIDFPLCDFRMGKLCERSSDINRKYHLAGVSNHSGGTFGGHYTAYCKNGNGKWYEYDDDAVEELQDVGTIVSNQAYVLIYESQDLDISKIIS
jgi:ubiquitin C-terminal hydrolase